MKRSWLARHPIGFMALYTIFYLSVFHSLEANVPLRSILVHCRLDDLIPFCKYAVIPYFAWFLWIPFTLFYLLWKAPREDFWRLCLPLFSGMTIALACYAVLPTALDLRPYLSLIHICRTILNALRVALRIISGNFILNFAFVALCGALQTHFHGRGRKGKRHLPRSKQKAPEGGCSPGKDVDMIRSWSS